VKIKSAFIKSDLFINEFNDFTHSHFGDRFKMRLALNNRIIIETQPYSSIFLTENISRVLGFSTKQIKKTIAYLSLDCGEFVQVKGKFKFIKIIEPSIKCQ
jgi:hypothetical protein